MDCEDEDKAKEEVRKEVKHCCGVQNSMKHGKKNMRDPFTNKRTV